MEIVISLAVGVLTSAGVWLVLRGNKLARSDESYSHSTADDALAYIR